METQPEEQGEDTHGNAPHEELCMQRPEGSYIPDYTDKHLKSIEHETLPPNFDKTCIVVVENRDFYNPEHKGSADIVVSVAIFASVVVVT